MTQSMGRREANRSSAVDGDSDEITDQEPVDDPAVFLPEDMSLAAFEQVVANCETILEIQKETRIPRWKVKRLLHHADMRDEVASTAQRVAALRDEDG